MSLSSALTESVLPVLAIAGAGYVLGRVREVSVDALATVTIYVLSPALVFHSLATTPLGVDTAARLGTGVGAYTLAMVAVSGAVGRALGESEPAFGALVLTSTFPNAGNYGIPLAAFAFGAVGRSTAVVYIVFQAVLMYTLGVYLASRGAAGSARGALLEVFKLPLGYAVAAAWLARWLGVVPPAEHPAMEAVGLTGDAAIPVMLLLLGVQLANTSHGSAIRRTVPAAALKLLVAPAVGAGVVVLVGLGGDVARVFVLACATPAAVTPLMLTVEYGTEHVGITGPEYVSTAILTSTVASVLTLTPLIAVLQSGGLA